MGCAGGGFGDAGDAAGGDVWGVAGDGAVGSARFEMLQAGVENFLNTVEFGAPAGESRRRTEKPKDAGEIGYATRQASTRSRFRGNGG